MTTLSRDLFPCLPISHKVQREISNTTSGSLPGFGSLAVVMSSEQTVGPSHPDYVFELPEELFGFIPTYSTVPPGPNPPVVSTLNSCPDLDEFAAMVNSEFGNVAELPDGLLVEDFIGNTLFGQVYRGKVIERRGLDNIQEANVLVKAWNDTGGKLRFFTKPPHMMKSIDDERSRRIASISGHAFKGSWRKSALGRFYDEMKLLKSSPLSTHHNMVKLIGSGLVNGQLAVAYELDPLDTLRNLLPRDEFGWFLRIKVAIRLASLIEAFHSEQLTLRNICADNVVLDQDFHPKLVDFGLLFGGDFGDIPPYEKVSGCIGYIDPDVYSTGTFLDKSDVFSYGVLLLELVTKRTAILREGHLHLDEWATTEYKTMCKKAHQQQRKKDCRRVVKKHKSPSLVHESLACSAMFDANDRAKITKLALRCVRPYPDSRPTMTEVVERLRRLEVAKRFML